MRKSRVSRKIEGPRDEKSLNGHILIITARWVLVVVGLVLALHRPNDLFELEFSIVAILVLAVINFFLHVSTVTGRTIQKPYIYAATVGDVVVISAIVAMTGGGTANSFVFYYPAVLAYTLVFPRMISLLFTAGVVGAYSIVAFPSLASIDANIDIFAVRLLSLVAMTALGIIYQMNYLWMVRMYCV